MRARENRGTHWGLWICLSLEFLHSTTRGDEETRWMPMPLPPYESQEVDAYLCSAFRMPEDMRSLTHVAPHAHQDVVHHILLFGCNEPMAPPEKVWSCHTHGICKDASYVLYGWGKNAPTLELPPGVGFSVGAGTHIPYIVLQVHYLNGRPAGDTSGVDIKLSSRMQRRSVGILTFAPGFSIPPGRPAYDVTADCCVSGFQPLVPLAFRVHAHALGRLNALDKSPVRWDNPASARLKVRMAERSPQLPQMFHNVDDGLPLIFPGDYLKATCTYNSTGQTRHVQSGWGHDAEMCNVYYMVYSEQTHFALCWGGGGMQAYDKMPDPVAVPFPLAPITRELSAAGESKVAKAPPLELGGITAVAVDPFDGTLWLLTRQKLYMGDNFYNPDNTPRDRSLIPEDTVYKVDATTGKVLSSWGGSTFSLPHSLTVDWNGDIWITDIGLHQVFKFSRTGKLLMALGKAYVPGNSNATFCRPTDVRTLPDGTVFIADGYCNSRVLKLPARDDGRNGLVVLDLFTKKKTPALVVHSVTLDACARQAVLAAREDGGVFVVDMDGKRGMTAKYWPTINTYHGLKRTRVWAVRTGPLGVTYMLLQEGYDWENGKVYVASFEGPSSRRYDQRKSFLLKLEGVKYPHDLAFGTLPDAYLESTVPVVIYVSETPPYPGSVARVHRFVLAKKGWSAEPLATAAALSPPPSDAPVRSSSEPLPQSGSTISEQRSDRVASGEAEQVVVTEERSQAVDKTFMADDTQKTFLERTGERSRMNRGWGTGLPDLVLQGAMGGFLAVVAIILYRRSLAKPSLSHGSHLPVSSSHPLQ